MSFVSEVNKAELFLSGLVKDTASIYVVDRFLGDFVQSSDSLILRNAKRGFLWTGAKELETEVLTQNSLARQGDWWKVLDETFYNALVSAFAEQTNLAGTLDNAFDGVVPQSAVKDAFVTALVLQGAKYAGDQFGDSVVKNISSLFK